MSGLSVLFSPASLVRRDEDLLWVRLGKEEVCVVSLPTRLWIERSSKGCMLTVTTSPQIHGQLQDPW